MKKIAISILALTMLAGCGTAPQAASVGNGSGSDTAQAQSLAKYSFRPMFFEGLDYVFINTLVARPLLRDLNEDVHAIVVGNRLAFTTRLVLGADQGVYAVKAATSGNILAAPTKLDSTFYQVGTWQGALPSKPSTEGEPLEVKFSAGISSFRDAGFGGLDTVGLKMDRLPSPTKSPVLVMGKK